MEEITIGAFRIYRDYAGYIRIQHTDSIQSIRLECASHGGAEVWVSHEGMFSAHAPISREALNVAFDILKGKSDDVSPEAETVSGIPECEFMLPDENSDMPSCRAQRPDENGRHPVCSEKTRHPYLDCQEIHRNFGTHQPEKSGE